MVCMLVNIGCGILSKLDIVWPTIPLCYTV